MTHDEAHNPMIPKDPIRDWYVNTIWGRQVYDDNDLFDGKSSGVRIAPNNDLFDGKAAVCG